MAEEQGGATFLRSITFEQVIKEEKELVTVKETDSVSDVLKILSQHRVLSAPVVRTAGEVSHSAIDMLDIVAYASTKIDLTRMRIQKHQTDQVREFLVKGIKNLTDMSQRNPWISFAKRKSIKKALPALGHPNMHRVWVTDDGGNPVGVLTQSKMLEILLSHKDKVEGITKHTLRELFPESRSPRIISVKEPLMEAFLKIHRDKVSGLGVISENGRLIGNVSATDLQFASIYDPMEFFNDLAAPIDDFLSSRKTTFAGQERSLFGPITVTLDDTLLTAMLRARDYKVHRVYVVDSDDKPIGVISLGDILSQFTLWS